MPAVLCSRCARPLNVPDAAAGEKVLCPSCATVSAATSLAPSGGAVDSEQATIPPAGDPYATVPPTESAAPPADDRAPPGYEVLGEVGRGGMGIVYRARQVALNREVALKMILSGSHADANEMARFRREGQAIARLQHPNIVAIHEVGEHNGRPFFSLEFCSGGSLEQQLAGWRPLPPGKAAALVQQLAQAMHAAHQAKVIHRDLKPANVLLTADGTPRITDFGLAKKLDESGHTRTGSVLGTPSYMAPEQAAGKKEVGPAADVYALGAILYACLTGRPPFLAATPFDTIVQVLSEEPVPPRQRNDKVPMDLETVCLKALHKDPKNRYGSAAALAEDLGRYLGGEPVHARPVGRLERSWKWVRRNPAVAALTAVLLLVLTVGGVVVVPGWREARRMKQERDQAVERAAQAEARRAELFAALVGRDEALKQARERIAELEKQAEQTGEAGAEAHLIYSLVQSIGRTSRALPDKAEQEALRKLALSSESVRIRFLKAALRNPGLAQRVGQRAEWVVQATVGLNQDLRREVERWLVWRIQEPGLVEEVVLACAWLGWR
jgi:serine/threonine-protein kinase